MTQISDLDISQFLSLPSSEGDLDYDISVAEDTTLLPPYDDSISRGIPLRICVLERPIDKFSLDPRPVDSEDDEFRVYAHMRDIAHIGVFSGDWVPNHLDFSDLDFITTTTIRCLNQPVTSDYTPHPQVNQEKSISHPHSLQIYPNQHLS